MGLSGELLSADLSNVFQMLSLNRKRGRLVIQDRANLLERREIHIDENHVCLVQPPPPRPVASLLLQLEVIDYDTLREAKERAARFGDDPADQLLRTGAVTKEDLQEALRLREEEDILEIFLWTNVRFTLIEGSPDPAGRPRFALDHLVMEAARRQDEWVHVTDRGAHRHLIYARCPELCERADLDLDAIHRIVLDHVDGRRGRAEVMEGTGLSRYFVDLALHALEEHGFVRALTLEELSRKGVAELEAGRVPDAIRLLRAALRHDRLNLNLHELLACARAAAQQVLKASAHLRYCAARRAEVGEVEAALELYLRALDLLPTDFSLLPPALELLRANPQARTARAQAFVDHGWRLLGTWLEVGEDAPALDLCETLAELEPENEELLEHLARLRLRSGRQIPAFEAYEALAARKEKRGAWRGALEIRRTLSSLGAPDRSRNERRIAELAGRLRKRAREKRGLRAFVYFGIFAVVVCLTQVIRASFATAELDRLQQRQVDDLTGARRMLSDLDAFQAVHIFTPAASRAADLRAHWVRTCETLTGQEEAARQAARQRRERAAERAEKAFARARRRLEAGDLLGAREELEEALREGRESSGEFDGLGSARAALRDVEEYLAAGRELLAASEEARSAGRIAEAHELLARALREHPLLPEVAEMRLSFRVRLAPANARMRVDGREVSAGEPLDFRVGRPLVVELEAPGHRPRRISLDLPPRHDEVAWSLVRLPERETHWDGRPVAVCRVGSRAVLVGASGALATLDPLSGRLLIARPMAPLRLHFAPIGGADCLWMLGREGRLRCARPGASGAVWEVEVENGGEALAFGKGPNGTICVLTPSLLLRHDPADGSVVERCELPFRAQAGAFGSAGIAARTGDGACALRWRGEAAFRLLGPRIEEGPVRDGSLGFLALGAGEVWRFRRGAETGTSAGPARRGDRLVPLAESAVILRGGRVFLGGVFLPVENPVEGVALGERRWLVARTSEGDAVVYDLERAEPLFGLEGSGGGIAAVGDRLVCAHPEGRVQVIALDP